MGKGINRGSKYGVTFQNIKQNKRRHQGYL